MSDSAENCEDSQKRYEHHLLMKLQPVKRPFPFGVYVYEHEPINKCIHIFIYLFKCCTRVLIMGTVLSTDTCCHHHDMSCSEARIPS